MTDRFASKRWRMVKTTFVPPPSDSLPPDAWARETVQRWADDVVLAAAVFKPNAAGNHDLSPSGFGDRQILKACCAYLGERVILGVTPLHVHAVDLALGGHLARTVGRWGRDELLIAPVAAKRTRVRNDPNWPAIVVCFRSGRPIAELQVLRHDEEAERVVELLLGTTCRRDATGGSWAH